MKSRVYRFLPLALLAASTLAAGCASFDTAKDPASQQHVHSPWRYKHMNHTHTRPWNKETKPPKPCEVASRLK
ncbi:MAG: hypothetical protein RBU21_12980 [FCB group bacterium]|jgi:hypothetical protein|nr:hypothetical protein [FCB group bacterium]